MFTYWFMYLLPAGFTILIAGRKKQRFWLLWFIVGLFFIILIGLRHQVGGDWFNYLRQIQMVTGVTLSHALMQGGDPGYVLLNWLMANYGWGAYGVNLVAAIFFVIGLCVFCRQLENPWLAFTIAVPYLIVVVAMGYTRQAIAIGLFFWAISYLEQGNFKYYIALLVFAALFHKTAVLMIPLGLFLYGKGQLIRLISVVLVVFGGWDLLLAEHQEHLWKNYVEAQMVSEGAKIRVLMNVLPSVCLLLYWRQWKQLLPNFWFWFCIAIGSIVSIALVDVASTAVDRIALYCIPIQLVIFTRLPRLVKNHFSWRSKSISTHFVMFVLILAYAAVLFVWLNYATHADYWLPYQNVIFL